MTDGRQHPHMTGAQYLISFLVSRGVRTVFGYPGAPLLEVYDAIRENNGSDSERRLRHILVRHEQGAAHAACGYAKACGFPGVCIATSGPGAINLATGIADAMLDSVPLLCVTGQVDTAEIGRDAFQEADIMGITIPVTKHNYLVKDISILKKVLGEAWTLCSSGRPGPVLVDIARDVLEGELPDEENADPVISRRRRETDIGLGSQLGKIRSELKHAYRPLILAGGGVVSGGASDSLSAFAARYSIPVALTLPGMGLVLSPDVNVLGLAGRYGTRAANAAMDQCDIVIAVGCRFSDRTVSDFDRFGRSHFIIHCDIDYAEISKNVPADLPVLADAGNFLSAMLKLDIDMDSDSVSSWSRQLERIKNSSKSPPNEPEGALSCDEVLCAVDDVCQSTGGCLYIADVGSHQMTAAKRLEPLFERGFITSCGLGVMGFALPASVGASYAVTDFAKDGVCRQIVCVCGDGGFQMTMQELATLKDAPLPVKILIMDNRSLGMIAEMQRTRFGDRVFGSKLENPDFAAIGAAYGIDSRGFGINDRPRLREAIAGILSAGHHVLAHFNIE